MKQPLFVAVLLNILTVYFIHFSSKSMSAIKLGETVPSF